MFIVDTNVISETMRAEPHVSVVTWLDSRPARDLFVTAITEAEIRSGVAMLPEGRRRRGLAEAAERVFGKMFAGRVLPFDSAAARAYAEIVAARRLAGRPISQADGQIAAIARCTAVWRVATRNVPDFVEMGVDVVDPWAGG